MTTRDVERIRFVTQHFNDLQGLRMVPVGLLLICQGLTSFFLSWPLVLLELTITVGSFFLIFRARSYYRTFGEVEPQPAGLGTEASSLSVYSPAGPASLAVERWPVKPALWLLIPSFLACALVFLLRAVFPATILMTDGSGVDPWVQLHTPVVEIMARPELPASWYEVKPIIGQEMYALFGAYFLSVWFLRGRRLSQGHYLALGAALSGLAALGSCLGVVLPGLWKLGIAGISRFFLLPLAHYWLALLLCGISLVLTGLLDHWELVRVLKPLREEPA
jgi:hypothetical protein